MGERSTFHGNSSDSTEEHSESDINLAREYAAAAGAKPGDAYSVYVSDRVVGEDGEPAASRKARGAWIKHRPSVGAAGIDLATAFPPAVAADIRPSKRKSVKRDYDSTLVFSDLQADFRRIQNPETGEWELIPIHDPRSMNLVRQLAYDMRPSTIVNLGDTVDLGAFSLHFDPDSDHFHRTTGPAFQAVHDFYAGLRADHPDARMVETDSNHNDRLRQYVQKHALPLVGYRRPGETGYPMLTYPYMASLDKVDVEWVSGYPTAEFELKPDFVMRHGVDSVANGSTAAKVSKNPRYQDRNYIQGHAHRAESIYKTDRHGKVIGTHVVAALCKTTGEVPSYHSAVDSMSQPVHYQQDWQNGVVEVLDDRHGNYQVNQIIFNTDGTAFYNGRRYDGNLEVPTAE